MHTTLAATIAENNISVLSQSPYSPDLAPSYFYQFPKLKMVMKGQCYDDVDAIEQKTTTSSSDASREKLRTVHAGMGKVLGSLH